LVFTFEAAVFVGAFITRPPTPQIAKTLNVDAAVDCYGGRVVATPEDLTPARPISPAI
jgi:hypothetical protein